MGLDKTCASITPTPSFQHTYAYMIPGIRTSSALVLRWASPKQVYSPVSSTSESLSRLLQGPAHRHHSLTMWYPRHMLQKRIAVFYGGATIAGASSGLLAFAISYMSGIDGLLGWSWIFVRMIPITLALSPGPNSRQIIEGLATIVVGLVATFGPPLSTPLAKDFRL